MCTARLDVYGCVREQAQREGQSYLWSLDASSTTRTSAASASRVYEQKPIWRGWVQPWGGRGPLVEMDGHQSRSLSMMLIPDSSEVQEVKRQEQVVLK